MLTSELAAAPVDLNRPPWELHVITGLQGDRFAILVKLHHALADGYRAVELGMGLLDGFEPTSPAQPVTQPTEWSVFTLAQSALGLLSRPDETLRKAAAAAADLRQTVGRTRQTLGIASAVLSDTRLPVPASPLAASLSGAKRVALLDLDLRDMRRIRSRHGGTTNDVLLAVITGALRQWLNTRGHDLGGLDVRALIPVNFRSSRSGRRRNELSGYLCDLPVSEPDPAVRLQMVRACMNRNKAAGPQHGSGAFPLVADQLPTALHRVATPVMSKTASCLFDTVVTNVPLPNRPVSLDGFPLQEMYPLAPLASGHALSIAASQYRDKVHIGLQVNRAALPDLEKLTEALPYAVTELDDLEPPIR